MPGRDCSRSHRCRHQATASEDRPQPSYAGLRKAKCLEALRPPRPCLQPTEYARWIYCYKEQRKFIRGTLVIPSYLAKGLEFEAVIVYDAGAGSYSHPDDRLLLYTACTRALHKLHIYHTGETSPLLSDIDSSLYEAVAYDSLQDGGKGSGQRDDR